MNAFRLSGRPRNSSHEAVAAEPARPKDVFRRFFDLIEQLERPRVHPPAPETKARISRLDDPKRRT